MRGLIAAALLAAFTSGAIAERADRPVCIHQGTYEAAFRGKHPFLFTFPKELSQAFVMAWNQGIQPAFSVPPTTESVSIYEDAGAMYRIVFFKNGCLVETIDVPDETFWKVIGAASGPGKYKI